MAAHGGCSKKMDAGGLDKLLSGLAHRCSSQDIQNILEAKPDAGTYLLGGIELAATVDVIYPAVLDPADFGVIAVNHATSDLYAVGATPLFALSILGVPKGLPSNSNYIENMLHASFEHLKESGILLIGGHSLIDQEDLMLGFSIVGKKETQNEQQLVSPGDQIVLTKKLGTSVATGLWKAGEHPSHQFDDVLHGMRKSNQGASSILKKLGVSAVTDVTGYGFMGHLINLLKRYNAAAKLLVDRVPLYDSLKLIPHWEQPVSRLFFNNKKYAESYVNNFEALGEERENFLVDAQVSGGLLAICSREQCAKLRILTNDVNDFSVVGEICIGNSGRVALV